MPVAPVVSSDTKRGDKSMEPESVMTDEQHQEFEAVTRPVIEWLNANGNPHMAIVIDPTSAVLYGGEIAYTTNDYLRD